MRSGDPVRVLQMFHNVRVGAGGAEKSLHLLLTGLSREDWDGRMYVALLDHGEGAENFDLGSATVLPFRTVRLGAPWHREWRFAWQVARFVRREGIGVIHAHMPGLHRLACLIGCRTGTPVIRSLRSAVVVKRPLPGILTRVWTRLTAAYVAVSPDQVRPVREGLGAPFAKIAYIPNGIDVDALRAPDGARERVRAELGIAPDQPLALSLGRLTPVKDFGTMARAAAIARRAMPSLRLVIAGEGEERPALERLIVELGQAEAIRLLGLRHDVADLLAAADWLAISSHSEGCPRAVMEAMSAGRAVVGTRVPGITAAVVDGKTGFLVPEGDADALAQAMLRLAGDAVLRDALGRAGRVHAVGHFSLAETLRRHRALYESLARTGRVPADLVAEAEAIAAGGIA